MKSELAILRDEWFESDEGKKCADINTLPHRQSHAKFLRNRLEAAFIAGAYANEKCQQIIAEKLLAQ